jgi:hypothetical protein
MTTFTATESIHVTIAVSEFADDADRAAARTATLALASRRDLAEARHRASKAPADWRSPGGADAAYVLDLMERDLAVVLDDADRTAKAARRARTADTAQHAAWAEQDAQRAASSARFSAGSIGRFLNYLPR